MAIVYGSSTGHTKKVAYALQKGLQNADLFDVSVVDIESLFGYDVLIFGSSTWGTGELQDDWHDRLHDFPPELFSQKTLAFFGLGDQKAFSETFLNAMGLLYDRFAPWASRIVGSFTDEEIKFDDSLAWRKSRFLGLAIDNDNQPALSPARIVRWIAQLNEELTLEK